MRRNLTQAELSTRAGLSQPLICNIETGDINDPKLSTMLKLSQALRCDVYDLVDTADNPSHDRAG